MNGELIAWAAAQSLGGIFSRWVGEHLGRRSKKRQGWLDDVRCDGCSAYLGISQLPLVGHLRGCRACGARGPARNTLPDWIASHVRAFEFYDGCSELLIPDDVPRNIIRVMCLAR